MTFSGLASLWLFVGFSLRPYVPPVLEPDPAFVPSEATAIEIVPPGEEWDMPVLARPRDTSPLFGSISRGTRTKVRGELLVESSRYCRGNVFYAIEPFGWVCAADTQPTTQPLTTAPALALEPGTSLPYRYVMVVVPEESTLPMWGSLDELRAHAEPERQLSRGDTVALPPSGEGRPTTTTFEGVRYHVSADGKVLPVENTYQLKTFSEWQGVPVAAAERMPFAWVTPRKAKVYDRPKGAVIEELERRTRVDVLEEVMDGTARWVRIGEGRFIRADQLNEVRKITRPEGTGTNERWIDVDLGEQVVVAYVRDQPIFATLTSSGRPPNRTPRGNYPVWGRASAVTMKSQSYDDKPYYVNRVPWVIFFQAHNALHAAYWHDRFGTVKSHGCANLAPKDARYLFEWLEPRVPAGWTGVRNWDLTPAPVVHVRDSSRQKPFVQERNVGPPDKEDEAKRLEQAIARRAAEAAAQAQLAAQGGMILPPGTQPPALTNVVPGTAPPIAPQPAALQVKPALTPPGTVPTPLGSASAPKPAIVPSAAR